MKNGKPLTEEEIVALLARLKDSAGIYPSALLESRRAAFLNQAGGSKIVIGSKAVYAKILHGIHGTSSIFTKAVLIPLISLGAVGTMLLAGYSLGWIQIGNDEPIVETATATPTETMTPTETATFTPTYTPTSTLTVTPKPTHDNSGLHLGQTPTPPAKRDGTP
jgi:hypothetical protein